MKLRGQNPIHIVRTYPYDHKRSYPPEPPYNGNLTSLKLSFSRTLSCVQLLVLINYGAKTDVYRLCFSSSPSRGCPHFTPSTLKHLVVKYMRSHVVNYAPLNLRDALRASLRFSSAIRVDVFELCKTPYLSY